MALELAEDGGLARPKILDRLLRFRKIALFAAFVGCYFYAQWCFDPANMEVTRISEHSLMPGLVTPKFEKSGIAIQMYRKLSELPKTQSQQKFIVDTFAELGLQCYTQKWRSTIVSAPMRGENVYGFVRGHRNDGAEAQLIVVQLGRSESSRRMLSRMLAFVDYAKDQVYWARDFVFVFVDGGEGSGSTERAALAMEAFLLKYQKIESISSENTRKRAVVADEIQAQTGALIAGVVYDLSGSAVKGTHIVNIETNGLNGQQVNLDVFNGIVKIADSKHSSRVAIFKTVHRHSNRLADISPFTIPMKAVYTQAFVPIEGIHSVMGKYGVQARNQLIMMERATERKPIPAPIVCSALLFFATVLISSYVFYFFQGLTVGLSHDYSERQSGQFIEEVSRMLNNVLERLHQSYFMYVLSDDMHFASVAFYMPVIGILLTPLIISAYYEWTKLEFFHMPFLYLILHCLGFSLYVWTTYVFSSIGTEFVIQWTEFPFFGVDGCDGQLTPPIPLIPAFIFVFSLPIGLVVFWKAPVKSVGSVRILCLLESSLIVGCLSLINFGLAIFAAAVVVPIVFMMTFESRQRTRNIFRTTVLTLLSPIGVMTYMAIHIPGLFGYPSPNANLSDFGLASKLTLTLIKQHVLFGAQHFFLLCCAAYPIWNMLFACSMYLDKDDEEEEDTTTTPPADPRPAKKRKEK